MVSDGIGNTEKACISKHFLVSGVTCRCRIGSTPKRKVGGSNPFWRAKNRMPVGYPIFSFSRRDSKDQMQQSGGLLRMPGSTGMQRSLPSIPGRQCRRIPSGVPKNRMPNRHPVCSFWEGLLLTSKAPPGPPWPCAHSLFCWGAGDRRSRIRAGTSRAAPGPGGLCRSRCSRRSGRWCG